MSCPNDLAGTNHQQQNDVTDGWTSFIYPFPGSRLSSDELLRALSAWLMPSSSPADGDQKDVEPSPTHDSDMQFDSCTPSTSVPMVFSHDEWFVQCVPALGVLLEQLLSMEEEEHRCRIRLMLRHLLALTVRIPIQRRHRDEMRLFIDTFGTLLRCSAQPADESVKRLAQKLVVVLLNRFEPVAQFLLLSRLFQLLVLRKISLSHDSYEPQLMAWLVDIYRTKCYAKTDEEKKETTAATNGDGTTTTKRATTVGELFSAQLGHFYAQIEDIVFEDLPASTNFYTSVCLLFVGQALRHHRPALLCQMGPSWLSRVREQFRDWRTMDEANKAVQRQHQQEEGVMKQKQDEVITTALTRQMAQSDEQWQLHRMEMLEFQLNEAGRCVEEALKAARN